MKKIIIIIISLVVIAAVWQCRFPIEKYFKKQVPLLEQNIAVQSIKQDISAPPPLIGNITGQSYALTSQGVIQWTNTNRAENGSLPVLSENAALDQAAQFKLQDLFKQQYFEHVNPQGIGPADLAKKVGYNFLNEGENLALGNFEGDEGVVTAWMNSPGHRANILNVNYTEIGVAVGKGKYEGHDTWIAVQEFGRPASDCPIVSGSLKAQIQTLQSQTNFEKNDLNNQQAYLNSTTPSTQQQANDYNAKVNAYNAEVEDYNNKVVNLKQLTDQYNSQVNTYNTCLKQ